MNMKKIAIIPLLSLLTLSPLAADGMQCGAGKCGSSAKSGGTDKRLMDRMQKDGYRLILSSDKPLTTGNNKIAVTVTRDGKPVTDVKVKIKLFMPEMPGMPYMEYKTKLKPENGRYTGMINLSMSGTWQYHLKFKDAQGAIHTLRGSLNL